MCLAELLSLLKIDINNIDNDATTLLHKNLFLLDVNSDNIEHILSIREDNDGDLVIEF